MSTPNRIIDANHLSLRIIKVIDIGNLLATDAFEYTMPEDFEEFIESTQHKCHPSIDALSSILKFDEFEAEPEVIHERLYGHQMFGFLLYIGTPVNKHTSETSYRYSWSNIYVNWVYGTTYDEAWEQAKNWAEEAHANDLSKFMKGGAA